MQQPDDQTREHDVPLRIAFGEAASDSEAKTAISAGNQGNLVRGFRCLVARFQSGRQGSLRSRRAKRSEVRNSASLQRRKARTELLLEADIARITRRQRVNLSCESGGEWE